MSQRREQICEEYMSRRARIKEAARRMEPISDCNESAGWLCGFADRTLGADREGERRRRAVGEERFQVVRAMFEGVTAPSGRRKRQHPDARRAELPERAAPAFGHC